MKFIDLLEKRIEILQKNILNYEKKEEKILNCIDNINILSKTSKYSNQEIQNELNTLTNKIKEIIND